MSAARRERSRMAVAQDVRSRVHRGTYRGTADLRPPSMTILAMRSRHWHILSLAGALALICGCSQTTASTSNHHDEDSGWVGPFAPPTSQANPATLAESRQLDAIQRSVDDGLYESARQQLKTLIEAGSQHPSVFYLQAKLLYQQGNYEAALPWCERAIGSSPYWVDPRIILAQSYIRLKRLAAAESVFGDLDRLAPRLAWGPYGIGVVALMRGDQARATTLLDEALRRDPYHAQSLRVRSELAQGNNPVLEESLLGRFLSLEPDSAWAYARLGELALSVNRLDDAQRSFLRSYELEPDSTIARRLAELAQRRNDTVEAKRWQERAGTKAPPVPAPAAHP